MTGETEILGESLPFEERIELSNWADRKDDLESYVESQRASVTDSLAHWGRVAKELDWQRPWDEVLAPGDHPHVARWFAGGALNLSQLALDRHVEGSRKNKVALIWESEAVAKDGAPAEVRKLTYFDLWREVNKFAFLLKHDFGMKKGDTMAVYLPMVPEAVVVLLAAARLGVIFTVVFSGFSAEALASRINDLGAKLLVTADGLNRRGKKVNLKDIADKALQQAGTVNQVIVVVGPLIEGATTAIYEGTLDHPQPDRWWQVIERYGVSVFYTTPTATRMQMRFGEDFVKKHDRSSLRLIHSVGEPINPSAWRWLFEVVGERRCPVGSTWWMTETGGIMISHLPGLMLVPLKPGTNGLPIPGVDADVVDDKGESVGPKQKGFLVIKNPSPGM